MENGSVGRVLHVLPIYTANIVMKKRIKVFLGSYGNMTQAQCLNCRALAQHLDKSKFDVAIRTVYSGDLSTEPLKGARQFFVRYPAKIWAPIQFIRGLLWADIIYAPSPERWRWVRFAIKYLGKKAFKTIEGAFIGTNITKAVALEGSVENVVESISYTGNTYSITEAMISVNKESIGLLSKDTVLYLGVDTDGFKNDVPRTKLTDIAIIGSNLFYKGLDDFFEVARRFLQLNFHVIGSGMGKVDPAAEIERLGLKNCRAHGSLDHKKLAELLNSIQLHIFPSRAEGFPKVTLETAAAGVPSVVYSDYGAEEWITTDKDGFVVKTIDEIAAVVDDLLAHPEKLQPLADNARALANSFDWRVRVKDWEREIEGVVCKK